MLLGGGADDSSSQQSQQPQDGILSTGDNTDVGGILSSQSAQPAPAAPAAPSMAQQVMTMAQGTPQVGIPQIVDMSHAQGFSLPGMYGAQGVAPQYRPLQFGRFGVGGYSQGGY